MKEDSNHGGTARSNENGERDRLLRKAVAKRPKMPKPPGEIVKL